MNLDRRLDYLADMRRAAEAARSFVSGMQEGEFLSDIKTQHAVGMSLIVIGESAVRLMETYPDFIEDHPDFPWHSIRGLRNRVAHGYFTLDLNIIWERRRRRYQSYCNGSIQSVIGGPKVNSID